MFHWQVKQVCQACLVTYTVMFLRHNFNLKKHEAPLNCIRLKSFGALLMSCCSVACRHAEAIPLQSAIWEASCYSSCNSKSGPKKFACLKANHPPPKSNAFCFDEVWHVHTGCCRQPVGRCAHVGNQLQSSKYSGRQHHGPLLASGKNSAASCRAYV